MIFIVTMSAMFFTFYASATETIPPKKVNEGFFLLDYAHELLGAKANFLANKLDSFFATERADDEFGRTRIRIRSQYLVREQAMGELVNLYRINLRLPHLEKKFRYEFGGLDKDDELSPEEVSELKKNKVKPIWIFNSDLGVSASINPAFTLSSRLRRNFEGNFFIYRLSEQLTFTSDQTGFIETTNFDFDHQINDTLLFRFINLKQWRMTEKDFYTNHGPTLIQQLGENSALNYSATTQTVIIDGVWYVDNYRLSFDLRQNLYKQWIYFDIIPGIDFPKNKAFRRNPFITFQLEVLFGS